VPGSKAREEFARVVPKEKKMRRSESEAREDDDDLFQEVPGGGDWHTVVRQSRRVVCEGSPKRKEEDEVIGVRGTRG